MTQPPKLTRLRSGWSVRIRYGADLRGRFRMPAMPEPEARARAVRLQRMGIALGEAGLHAAARVALKQAASERDSKLFAKAESVAAQLIAESSAAPREINPKTFRDVCRLWWTGELHRMAPDRVSRLNSTDASQLKARLELICETVGDVPIARFTLDTAERALAALPRRLASTTRRAYAHRLARVIKLAALPPLRLIESNPIPSGWAPKKGPRRERAFLYPSEDKQLLRCNDVDIERRWLYAFLAREGCRLREALALKWSDFDLERHTIKLDRNKTRRPRTWRIGQDVASALSHLRQHHRAADGDRVFHTDIDKHAATQFRADLTRAGVKRSELFESSSERGPMRAHDLRATFITLALAAGKTETWVMDRTGHTTSAQLQQYRRPARLAEELAMGWFDPMDQLLVPGRYRAGQRKNPTRSGTGGRMRDTAHLTQSATSGGVSDEGAGKVRPSPETVPARNVAPGHSGADVDPIELELAAALRAATAAGAWGAVETLARELGERRRAREGQR